MELTLRITKATDTETLGELYIEGEFFGFTLEDSLKESKIKNDTCIPFGKYQVEVTHSPRFKKRLPLVYNRPDLTVKNTNGDTWAGIRFHGGNSHWDTEGCILVARNLHINTPATFKGKEVNNWIQGSLSDKLVTVLDTGEVHTLSKVRNFSFNDERTRIKSLLYYLTTPYFKDDNVCKIENALTLKGFPISTGGVFEEIMDKTVREFQASRGLIADGIVGMDTLRELGLTSLGGDLFPVLD